MPLIAYKPRSFSPDHQDVIASAVLILNEYARQGFDLTLRQLYYQFVARDLIPNHDRSYKRLGAIVNDARLAGEIDWDHIVDRTRFVREEAYWASPASIIEAAMASFQLDKWATQDTYVEVWVEKDALIGVIERVCRQLETSYLSCRGYVSQSEMWRAARRFGKRAAQDQNIMVFHLGDHDPSGVDMSRDIETRIREFLWGDGYDDAQCFSFRRIALNWDQIQQYDPPPNPAKLTDVRARRYIAEHGRESWELDALEPSAIASLIEEAVLSVRDKDAWEKVEAEQKKQSAVLRLTHERWDDVAAFLQNGASHD